MGEAKVRRELGLPPREKSAEPQLFMWLPTYGGQRHNTMPIIKAITGPKSFRGIALGEIDISLLAMGFNIGLVKALDGRKHGITHFLLLHADIIPMDDDWLVTLHREMAENGAKVISAVSPIKDSRGLTSIGLEGPTKISPRRLTMTEIMDNPETFTHPDLLVNTGMLLIDIREPWIENICFTIKDSIIKNPNGTFTVGVEPEDWDFSRQCRALGVDLWATRKVKLIHKGTFSYPNFSKWGTAEQDPGDQRVTWATKDSPPPSPQLELPSA